MYKYGMSLEELETMYPFERIVYLKLFEKFLGEEKEVQEKANQKFN